MIKAFEKASGKTLAYKECPRRSGDLASVYADPTLAGKELGWTAQRDLDEMCKLDFILIRYYIIVYVIGQDLWRWQSNNPNGFQ
jgi:UDP-glucose 4-epimerase